ncbi:MAG: hypothetical protein EOP80_13260 [Variovorax sp.]|nr:MAG: hypothetical protein EOP80_13260 [Variovorax sp.]
MPSIRLDVPVEAQEYDFSCWHSAAYMVWLYWQQNGAGAGPMNTIASSYAESQSQGISAAKFIVLAQKVGLMAVPPKKTYTETDLYNALKKYGPLWAAGTWDGQPHIVVITGVDKGYVYYNDPDGGEQLADSLSWFNTQRSKLPAAIMAKNPAAY